MNRPVWISILVALVVGPIVFWGRAHPETWPIGVPIMLGMGFLALLVARIVTGRWPN